MTLYLYVVIYLVNNIASEEGRKMQFSKRRYDSEDDC